MKFKNRRNSQEILLKRDTRKKLKLILKMICLYYKNKQEMEKFKKGLFNNESAIIKENRYFYEKIRNNVNEKRVLKHLGLTVIVIDGLRTISKGLSYKERVFLDSVLTLSLNALKTYHVILYAKLLLDHYPQFNPYLQPFRGINFLTEGPIRLMGIFVPMRVRPYFDYRFMLLATVINTLIRKTKKCRDLLRAGGRLTKDTFFLF